jgi:hypothetical protein
MSQSADLEAVRAGHLPLESDPGRLSAFASGIYLLLLVSIAGYHMAPALFRSWYFSSDEYVFAAEVIRFLHFDFRQHFFDIPGTPFMFVAAILWVTLYGLSCLIGRVPAPVGLERFTFENIAGMFVLMRSLTLLFFLCSLVLVFLVASRLTNRVGGCTAAFLLAISPIYASYSSLVRTESLAVCLFLAALLCLLPMPDRVPGLIHVLAAGLLAGIAAGARLHSITATVPLLLILVFLTSTRRFPYPRWAWWFWGTSIGSVLVFGGLFIVLLNTVYRRHSSLMTQLGRLTEEIVVAVAVIAGTGSVAYALRAVRPIVRRIIGPRTVLLLIGMMLGVAIAIPTIVPQWRHFIQSFEMYRSTYRDFDRESLSLLANVTWILKFYGSIIAPDWALLCLLVGGGITVLAIRNKWLLAILAGAMLFFVSKPINVRAAPHHVILWLPLFAIVSAYPIATAWGLRLRVRGKLRRLSYSFVVIAFAAMVASGTQPGFMGVGRSVAESEQRMRNIAMASDWIKRNTEADSVIAVAYFCFNPDVFYAWLHSLEVPVPPSVFDGREYLIWWGRRSALAGKAGYAMATRADVISLKQGMEEVWPGDGTDPFSDQSFTLVRVFGEGSNAVSVFHFSLPRVSGR